MATHPQTWIKVNAPVDKGVAEIVTILNKVKASSRRTAWRKLTEVAGIKGFRFHDCRHHAITELAESQASDSTIMALAGHVSRKMLEHYSHVRQEAKREAVNVLSAKRPSRPRIKGYDTNNDANPVSPEQVPSYVVEKMVGTRRLELLTFPAQPGRSNQMRERNFGRHEETRTPDLYRVKVAL